MNLRNARLAISTGTVLALLAAALAPACGGNTSKKVAFDPGGGAGEAGASGSGGNTLPTGGSSGKAGAAGASSGKAGAAGTSAAAGTSGSFEPGGEGNVAGEGGAAGANDGSTGQLPPNIDAGPGCIAPSGEFLLSPASAGLPVPGLKLWLRGDHGVYKMTDNRVCAWLDQSGNDFLIASTAGNLPLWDATGVGGMPAIHFDAQGRLMIMGGVLNIPATSARTVIAVVQLVDTSARFAVFEQGQNGSPGTYLGIDSNTYNTAGNREGVYLMNNSYDSALATATTPRVHVYTIQTMTVGTPILGAIDYRVNGETQTLTRNGGGLGNGNFEDFSTADLTLIGNGPDAFIAEELVYDRALSISERASVEHALEARYGIH